MKLGSGNGNEGFLSATWVSFYHQGWAHCTHQMLRLDLPVAGIWKLTQLIMSVVNISH